MTQRLEAAGDAPARMFISDGVGVVGDDCCDGLAWVRVATIQPTDASGATLSGIRNASIPVFGHSIILEAGTLRCSPTMDSLGRNVTPDDHTRAAQLAASDRQALRMALLCDFPADVIAANADGNTPSAWLPLNAGGCGGGYMTTTIGTSMII